MKPAVIVLGATGQVGLFAVAELLKAGRAVVAVTRRGSNHQETSVEGLRRLDVAQLREILDSPPGSQNQRPVLLSCGPVELARRALTAGSRAAAERWQRAVIIGTTSIRTKQSSSVEAERRQVGEIEETLLAIRDHCRAAGIPLTLLEPTLIYGCGMDQNLSRVYRWICRAGFAPVASRAVGLRQPLHVEDLAATIVNAIQSEPAVDLQSAVCGGSKMTYEEMIGGLFDAAGRKPRLLRLPPAGFSVVAAISKIVPGLSGINTEMFRRQSRDLVFDDSLARNQLHHAPRPFSPGRSDFELPAAIEEIRRALG